MIPRWHIVLGLIFTAIVYFSVPGIEWYFLLLIFLSSFLIDFDHYVASVIKTGNIGLFKSFEYHRKMQKVEKKENEKGIRQRGDFHLFHTIEFHALIGLLGLFWVGFVYIFIGMVFHSLIDVISLIHEDRTYRREFFFFNWIRNKI